MRHIFKRAVPKLRSEIRNTIQQMSPFFPQEQLATRTVKMPLEPILYRKLIDRLLWTVWHFLRSALCNCPLLACDWETLDEMTGYAEYGWKDDESKKAGDLWMTGNSFSRVLFNRFESGPLADGTRSVCFCCFGGKLCPARTWRGNVRFYCIDFLPLAVIKLLWTETALGFTRSLQLMADCVVFELNLHVFLPFFCSLLFKWMKHEWVSFYDWTVCVCPGRQIGMLGTDMLELCIYCEMVPIRVATWQSSARWQLASATAKSVCVCAFWFEADWNLFWLWFADLLMKKCSFWHWWHLCSWLTKLTYFIVQFKGTTTSSIQALI